MKENFSNRFLEFAARIIELGKILNRTFEGRHVYGQLFRSSTSSGANYEESHSAQSTRDFIHKREIVLKELRESLFWLRLISKAELVSRDNETLVYLLKECDELTRVIASSVSTTKARVR